MSSCTSNSDENLRKICYDKAMLFMVKSLSQVKERLEHELTSIISNGFAVMYIIARSWYGSPMRTGIW